MLRPLGILLVLALLAPTSATAQNLLWHAPDSIASNVLLTWPNVFPAANGQPLVCNTAVSGVGACSFAAGTTGTRTVRASGGAADCTLIFTGGVLTGGTC